MRRSNAGADSSYCEAHRKSGIPWSDSDAALRSCQSFEDERISCLFLRSMLDSVFSFPAMSSELCSLPHPSQSLLTTARHSFSRRQRGDSPQDTYRHKYHTRWSKKTFRDRRGICGNRPDTVPRRGGVNNIFHLRRLLCRNSDSETDVGAMRRLRMRKRMLLMRWRGRFDSIGLQLREGRGARRRWDEACSSCSKMDPATATVGW